MNITRLDELAAEFVADDTGTFEDFLASKVTTLEQKLAESEKKVTQLELEKPLYSRRHLERKLEDALRVIKKISECTYEVSFYKEPTYEAGLARDFIKKHEVKDEKHRYGHCLNCGKPENLIDNTCQLCFQEMLDNKPSSAT